MARRGGYPNLNPYELDQLKLLKSSLAGGLDPSFAGEQLNGILQGAQTRVQNRQAQLAPLTDALLQQAQAGAPIGAATALTNAYSTMTPGLQAAPVQNKLGAFTNALYPQGGTSPLYAAPAAETAPPLGPEDYAQMDTTIQHLMSTMQPGTQFPYGLHEITMEIIAPLRAQGYDEQAINTVQQYIAQRYQSWGGQTSGT